MKDAITEVKVDEGASVEREAITAHIRRRTAALNRKRGKGGIRQAAITEAVFMELVNLVDWIADRGKRVDAAPGGLGDA